MPKFNRIRRRGLTKRSKEIIGLDETFKKLNDLADVIDQKEVVDVLLTAARMGRDEIKDTAPRGEDAHPPGWLKIVDATFASEGKPEKDQRGPSVLFGINAKKAPQAFWQEFGFHPAGGTRFVVHPFFRIAVAAVRPALAATIQDGLERQIEKATK